MRRADKKMPNSFTASGPRHLSNSARSAAAWQGGLIFLFLIACLSAGCALFRAEPRVSPQLRKDIVSIALQYRDSPYRRQGRTPGGFDCSGFVQFVFQQAGIEIPRTSKGQYKAGEAVDRSELKRGDLVFFVRWGWLKFFLPPSHVGIYIGASRFVHAPSPGQTVRVDSLAGKHWKAHYKGGRNLL
jgi:cell wall-associated NlpC family hydrolase